MKRATRMFLAAATATWLSLFEAGCGMNQMYLPAGVETYESLGTFDDGVQYVPRARGGRTRSSNSTGSCH